MAPSKVLNVQNKPATTNAINGVVTRRGLASRQTTANMNVPVQVQIQVQKPQPTLYKDTRIKRKADASPLKDKLAKRSALGNITNVCIKLIFVTMSILNDVYQTNYYLIPGHRENYRCSIA